MKRNKRILGALLLTLVLGINNIVFAADVESPPITEENLVDVLPEDVPEGVIPMEFDSEEEAMAFIDKYINNMVIEEPENVLDTQTRSTDRTLLVGEEAVGPTASVKLYANYGTSGNASTGTITYIDPYTTFTGFTLGFHWEEKTIGYRIQSNKKDAYIYTSGQLDYYFILEGGIKLGSRKIDLGRTCYLAR